MQRLSFSNSLAPADRISFWQFGLVRRFDSVELHGRPRSRKCDRLAFEPPSRFDRFAFTRDWNRSSPFLAAPCYLDFLSLGQWLRPIFQAFWHHQDLLNILRFSFRSWFCFFRPRPWVDPACAIGGSTLYRRQSVASSLPSTAITRCGAVAGALLGEGYLVRRFGLPGTGLIAASLSSPQLALRGSSPEQARHHRNSSI